jgi:hypothetical protein
MSFKFQGHKITYNDIYKYFEDMKISRDNYKKSQIELKKNEHDKYKETLEIIKNHSDFLLDLNDKKLCKYGGNSSIVSVFKFNPLNTDNYDKNNYELIFKDDGGIDEVSNLLSLVIKHKNKKETEFDYLNRKINICIILTSITFGYLLFIKK